MSGIKKITGDLVVTGQLSGKSIVSIGYASLKALRDAGTLVPGQQYRITDFVTTTAQSNTQSAGHAFDLIVVADSVNKLNERARAIRHEGDTYFANSKLEAWQVWYSLDNDTNRFAWADTANGKGVIYRMIDEFNNDCPYDFKNVQFTRKLTNGALDLVSGVNTWVYTFTLTDLGNTSVVDISLKQNTEYPDDEEQCRNCSFNTIKEAILDYQPDGLIRLKLNDNVFLNIFDPGFNLSYYGCYSNTFGNNCYSNTFGNGCYSNTFGNNCYSNTFGNGCYYNTFGNNCYSNTFGNGCYYNTFGNNCYSNTFGNICFFNIFDKYCYSNTFGNVCYYLKISDSSSTLKQHIRVDSGLRGASGANQFDLYDPAILNKNYQVAFKNSASGKYLMLWANDNGAMTGKIKAANTTPTWSDIV